VLAHRAPSRRDTSEDREGSRRVATTRCCVVEVESRIHHRAHRRNHSSRVVGRGPVANPDHEEPERREHQVASVVTVQFHRRRVVRTAVALDHQPIADNEIESFEAAERNAHLRRGDDAIEGKEHPDDRLGSRLGAGVDELEPSTKPSREPGGSELEIYPRHPRPPKDRVEDGDRDVRRLRPQDLAHQRGGGRYSVPRRAGRATNHRRGRRWNVRTAGNLNDEVEAGRCPEPECPARAGAGEPTTEASRLENGLIASWRGDHTLADTNQRPPTHRGTDLGVAEPGTAQFPGCCDAVGHHLCCHASALRAAATTRPVRCSCCGTQHLTRPGEDARSAPDSHSARRVTSLPRRAVPKRC
jgi:hypothetical protein